MQAGDPDIGHQFGAPSEQSRGELGLPCDGEVGRAGRRHHHQPATRLGRLGGPPQQPGLLVVAGVGEFAQDRRSMLGAGAGEDRPCATLADRRRDQPQLGRCLRLAVHRLGVAAPLCPVEVRVGHLAQRVGRLPGVLSHG